MALALPLYAPPASVVVSSHWFATWGHSAARARVDTRGLALSAICTGRRAPPPTASRPAYHPPPPPPSSPHVPAHSLMLMLRQRLTSEVKSYFKEVVGCGVAACLRLALKWAGRRSVSASR
jgi:hypothetical protein